MIMRLRKDKPRGNQAATYADNPGFEIQSQPQLERQEASGWGGRACQYAALPKWLADSAEEIPIAA